MKIFPIKNANEFTADITITNNVDECMSVSELTWKRSIIIKKFQWADTVLNAALWSVSVYIALKLREIALEMYVLQIPKGKVIGLLRKLVSGGF